MSEGVMDRYRQFLPVTDKTPNITLGEGSTPLVRMPRVAKEIGFNGELLGKVEGANPTHSFKDRGMVVAVAKAVEEGAEILICASTGNTASSAAAYGAKAGLSVIVLVPKDGVARGKLCQMSAYGALVVEIDSTFDKCQDIVREIAARNPKIALVNSTNPYRLEGQKTAAFEVWDELKIPPDYLFIPVGNAGNITAYWMGFKEWREYTLEHEIDYWFEHSRRWTNPPTRELLREDVLKDMTDAFAKSLFELPKMMGYQAAGAAPIVLGHPVLNPQTIASAIRVGNPANWQGAIKARDESGGKIDMVTDDEILVAYKMIPRLAGIFCELASAAAVAGLTKAIREYPDFKNSEHTVAVCVLTGDGLKDPENAAKVGSAPLLLDADANTVARELKL